MSAPKKKKKPRKKLVAKKIKKKIPVSFTTDDAVGQRRIEVHWDKRHKSEKGYGGPFISPREMQDYINAEARHWEQVHQMEGDYGDEGKRPFGDRYSKNSPEEKRRRKERAEPNRGFGQEMQDIEDEKFDDEDYHPKRQTS